MCVAKSRLRLSPQTGNFLFALNQFYVSGMVRIVSPVEGRQAWRFRLSFFYTEIAK